MTVDRDTELANLRREVARLSSELEELKAQKVDVNPEDDDWEASTDWELSATHWSEDGWESSSADC